MELQLKDIKKVLILGAGTLGSRVGLQAAVSGYDVAIYDISEKAFERARKTHDYLLGRLLKNEIIKPSDVNTIKDRILWTTDPEIAAENADIINESVTEDPELKKKVWAQFGALCPEKTLFTTNTSYLLPSQLADSSGRPERFCAFHFHDVFHANVVDVMPHPGTDQWVVDFLVDFGKTLKQTPVVILKESHGYLFNRMFGAILSTAGLIVAEGISSHEDVDRSWMGNFKMKIGPFGMMDEVGLDTAWHVTQVSDMPKKEIFSAFLKSYIDQGKLGIKTGEGFYKYPKPRYKDADFIG
ncbi:MAG: 3-hydroxyacyl-CoA dehydrogenase [Bacteroidota bacterium]